jgi:hypothetical protein
MVEGWRRQHNEELQNLYCSPNIIIMIKRRKVIRAGHVTRMAKGRMHVEFLR